MTFSRITSAIATLTLGAASFGAHAVIVNIDSRSSTGTSISLDAGSYTLSWAGIAGGGVYDAWQFNNAASGNFRNAFTVTAGSVVRTYDLNDGVNQFNAYETAGAALSAFQTAAGANQFVVFNTPTDSSPTGEVKGAPFSFTFDTPVALTFTVPDHLLSDNTGGVSLAITAAVPEPETYALMLAGLAAMGFVAKRRKPAAA